MRCHENPPWLAVGDGIQLDEGDTSTRAPSERQSRCRQTLHRTVCGLCDGGSEGCKVCIGEDDKGVSSRYSDKRFEHR